MKKNFILIFLTCLFSVFASDKTSFFTQSNYSLNDITQTITGHTDSVNSISFSPNNKFFATASDDNSIKIWDISSDKEIYTFSGHSASINSISWSPNGKYIASASSDNSIKIWDISSGKEIYTLLGHSASVNSISWSPNGKYIASTSSDKTIKIWDSFTKKELYTITDLDSLGTDIIWNPNSESIASIGSNNSIKIWDISSGTNIYKFLNSNSINSISWSPNGKYIASLNSDKTIKIWDVTSTISIKTIFSDAYSMTWSPDSNFLATISKKNMKIVNIFSEKDIYNFSITFDLGNCISWSPNGKYISAGSFNGSIKLCNVSLLYDIYAVDNTTNILNENGNVIASLPTGYICSIDFNNNKILKPLLGNINSEDFEKLYISKKNFKFYCLNDTNIFESPEEKITTNEIKKGEIIDVLYYSPILDLYYINDNYFKGWISPENIGILKKQNNKSIFINNNNSYNYIDSDIKNKYISGNIINTEWIDITNLYLYSYSQGWINKNDIKVIQEQSKEKKVYSNKDNVKFNLDFTGNNYKNISIATEYTLLGSIDNYYLVKNISTNEIGWILQADISLEKPDLNDPIIIISNTFIDPSTNMLTIEGKVYDDTSINKVLLNSNEISIKKLDSFDKLNYIPEVGYAFNSQWFLLPEKENNIEIKVIDRDGKEYSKTLKYSPQLKTINLDEFKIENIIVKQIPKLDYTINLKDENGDGILTGSETINLVVTVKNNGEGEAKNVNLKIDNPSNNEILYKNTYFLGTILPNETKTAVIDFNGQDKLKIGKALYNLNIEEGNGFNPFPAKFSFNVEPKLNSKLEIIDYAIDDDNKNGQIEQNEKFDLYVLVQNTGEGDSKNTILDINKKADGIVNMSENTIPLDTLKSGESRKIKFSFVTNFQYKGNGDLPFDINLYNEKNTDKANKSITLAMNKVIPTIKEVNLESKKKDIIVASKISIMSDIDDSSKLIAKEPDSKKWAVVIGVENYKKAPNVEFAERDALVTKEYFNKLLGVPKENIYYLSNSDATKTELETLLKVTLKNRVSENDQVYFYFSGHGVPTNEGDSYLLLNDSDPSNPKISAYAIKELYEDLGTLKTKNSYAFLDTCFSGGVARGDEKESLLGGTRAVMKVKDISLAYNNLTIYTATSEDQLSNSYKDQGHGLFTYYMLRGLAGEADINKDNNITNEELENYISANVSDKSRKLYGESRYQNPTLKTKKNKEFIK